MSRPCTVRNGRAPSDKLQLTQSGGNLIRYLCTDEATQGGRILHFRDTDLDVHPTTTQVPRHWTGMKHIIPLHITTHSHTHTLTNTHTKNHKHTLTNILTNTHTHSNTRSHTLTNTHKHTQEVPFYSM